VLHLIHATDLTWKVELPKGCKCLQVSQEFGLCEHTFEGFPPEVRVKVFVIQQCHGVV
jgi:hypothetical protein